MTLRWTLAALFAAALLAPPVALADYPCEPTQGCIPFPPLPPPPPGVGPFNGPLDCFGVPSTPERLEYFLERCVDEDEEPCFPQVRSCKHNDTPGEGHENGEGHEKNGH